MENNIQKSYRIYDPGNPDARKELENLGRIRLDHPQNYVPESRLIDAVNVAIRLGKPLLITGDPGTGKPSLHIV